MASRNPMLLFRLSNVFLLRLADRQFLPRYGFPIGLQKLQVIVPDEGSRNGTFHNETRLTDPREGRVVPCERRSVIEVSIRRAV